jgi:hypothetical protein
MNAIVLPEDISSFFILPASYREEPAKSEKDAAKVIASWLNNRFVYTPDDFQYGFEHWPTKTEIYENLQKNRNYFHDDCDGHAFAAIYAAHELGYKARSVACWTEPAYDPRDGKIMPRYHAVAEFESGRVVDNRYPGIVTSWPDLKRVGYRPHIMSGFFCFEEGGPRAL